MGVQLNGHQGQPLPQTWNQKSQEHQFNQEEYSYTSVGPETNDFSTDEYDTQAFPQGRNNAVMYSGEGGGDNPNCGNSPRNPFQVSETVQHTYTLAAG